MDIEEFYEADSRRRGSSELELGRDWHDAHGVRYELSWIEATGELYVMREPVPKEWATPFGGIHVHGAHSTDTGEIEGMTVSVVGTVASRDQLEAALQGWEAAMPASDSIAWLVERLQGAAIVPPAGAGAPITT